MQNKCIWDQNLWGMQMQGDIGCSGVERHSMIEAAVWRRMQQGGDGGQDGLCVGAPKAAWASIVRGRRDVPFIFHKPHSE